MVNSIDYLADMNSEIIQLEKEMKKKGIKNRILKGLDDYFQAIEELEKAGLIKKPEYNISYPFSRSPQFYSSSRNYL